MLPDQFLHLITAATFERHDALAVEVAGHILNPDFG
jgi:hypothetical protein